MADQIASFRDLRVYKSAIELQQVIFQISKAWPQEEKFSLTDQMRRSSRSIGANIAESWAKRNYPSHFISKLTDADGELQETSHWISTALNCQYLSEAQHAKLQSDIKDDWKNARKDDVHAREILRSPRLTLRPLASDICPLASVRLRLLNTS